MTFGIKEIYRTVLVLNVRLFHFASFHLACVHWGGEKEG